MYILTLGHIFHQFEQALTTDQNELLLDEPLTSNDWRFLKGISLHCAKKSTILDLTSFTKKDIQGYGIIFKLLHGMNINPIYSSLAVLLYWFVIPLQWYFS